MIRDVYVVLFLIQLQFNLISKTVPSLFCETNKPCGIPRCTPTKRLHTVEIGLGRTRTSCSLHKERGEHGSCTAVSVYQIVLTTSCCELINFQYESGLKGQPRLIILIDCSNRETLSVKQLSYTLCTRVGEAFRLMFLTKSLLCTITGIQSKRKAQVVREWWISCYRGSFQLLCNCFKLIYNLTGIALRSLAF